MIGSQHTGFLKNRFIGENIRLILDIIDYSKQFEIPGFMLLVDFEKAFDKIEWGFIYRTLSYFNFGRSLKSWIKVFYHGSSTCVCNNGLLYWVF